MYPFIYFLGFEVPVYWLIGLVGAIVCFEIIRRRAKRQGLHYEDVFSTLIFAITGALIGAKLLYIITMLPEVIANFGSYIDEPQKFINLLRYGIVYYGGLLGGLCGGYAYIKKYQLPATVYADLVAPMIPLFHVFGRIGCFMAGCCYGIECEFGISYTHSIAAPNGVSILPIQLIEAGCNLILFAALLATENKRKKGTSLPLYLFAYAIIRFVVEFFRGDEIRGHVWLLSTSQWISLAIIAALIIRHLRSTAVPPSTKNTGDEASGLS